MKFYSLLLLVFFISSKPKAAFSNPAPKRDFLRMNLPVIGNKWPYRSGSLWVSLQMSRAFITYPSFGSQSGLPPLQLSIDHSFDNHWALGVYGGFFNSTYTDNFGNEQYSAKIKAFNGGLRLTLHFSDIFNNAFAEVLNVKKWDLYSTMSAGWYSYKWQVAPIYTETRDYTNASFGSLGLVLGLKWIPTPKYSLFVEGGKGPVGWVSFGLAGKLIK
jgi:hypothetical protein